MWRLTKRFQPQPQHDNNNNNNDNNEQESEAESYSEDIISPLTSTSTGASHHHQKPSIIPDGINEEEDDEENNFNHNEQQRKNHDQAAENSFIDLDDFVLENFGVDLKEYDEDTDHLIMDQHEQEVLMNSKEQIFVCELTKLWHDLYRAISKQEKQYCTTKFVVCLNTAFVNGMDIKTLVSLNAHLNVGKMVKKLSFEYIEEFCDVFDIANSHQLRHEKLRFNCRTRIDGPRAKEFFFLDARTSKEASTTTETTAASSLSIEPTIDPCNSRATLILKALCLLTTSLDPKIPIVSNLASSVILTMRFFAKWVGIEREQESADDSGNDNITTNDSQERTRIGDYSIFSGVCEQLANYFEVDQNEAYFKTNYRNDDAVDCHTLKPKDKNPCIIAALLLKNICRSPLVFTEVFNETNQWKQIIALFISIKEQENFDWRLYIQFADIMLEAGAIIFEQSSNVIGQLHEISMVRVTSFILGLVNHSLSHCETLDIIDSDTRLKRLHMCLIRRLSLMYLTELCIFGLYKSLHVIPGLFMEFEQQDGYIILQRLFDSITSINVTSSYGEANNAILQFQQQKMLVVLRILVCLVIDFVKNVQQRRFVTDYSLAIGLSAPSVPLTNANPFLEVSRDPPIKWKHNNKVLVMLLALFNHIAMEDKYDLEDRSIEFRERFCCKRELLVQIVELLRFFPLEYVRDLNDSAPFKYLCDNFTSVNYHMQISILAAFKKYMTLFCRYVVANGENTKGRQERKKLDNIFSSLKWGNKKAASKKKLEDDLLVQALCRDFHEYCRIFSFHQKSPLAISRVCSHAIDLLSTVNRTSCLSRDVVQYMFRLSGLPHILLESLNIDSEIRNRQLSAEMLNLLYSYLYQNEENHRDFIEAGGLFKFATDTGIVPIKPLEILYSLLYDAQLIEMTLTILYHIVVVDTDQKWSFIIADMVSVLGNREENCQKYRGQFTLRMCNLILSTIRRMLVDNPSTKDSFRACGGFECMINLLCYMSTLSDDYEMIFEAVQLIIFVVTFGMENNYCNQQYFNNSISFSSFLDPLHKLKFIQSSVHGLCLSMNLLQLSLMKTDLLACESFNNSESVNRFSTIINTTSLLYYNPEVITEVLLKLFARNLESIDSRLSMFFFSSLLRLNSQFSGNCHKLCKTGAVSVILTEFPSVLMNQTHYLQATILEHFILLANHNFSVQEIQQFFYLIHPNDYSDIFPDNVLEAFMHLSMDSFSPSHYINFPSLPNKNPYSVSDLASLSKKSTAPIVRESAVLLPQIAYSPWPPARGYTISCWFNVEKILAGELCLFSLSSRYREMLIDGVIDSDKHFAIKLFAELNSEEETSDQPTTRRVKCLHTRRFEKFKFKKHKWYLISLTHTQSVQKEKIKESFILYVNGLKVDSAVLEHVDSSYLRFFKSVFGMSGSVLQNVALGLSVEDLRNNTDSRGKVRGSRRIVSLLGTPTKRKGDQQITLGESPSFQIGNTFMFEGTLTDSEVYMIYFLGPNYVGTFDEDISQYYPNEIINDGSVNVFPQDIYYMRECSNNFGLSQLSERILFVFSARDATFATRTVVPRSKDKVASPSGSVDTKDDIETETEDDQNQIINENLESYLPDDNAEALKVTKSVLEFVPMKAMMTGSAEVISRFTFKTNLYAIGGMEPILGLLTRLDDLYAECYSAHVDKRQKHKVILLQVLAHLVRYDACNTSDMINIEGYDLINHLLLKKKFLVDDSVLCSLLAICGLNITPTQIADLTVDPIDTDDNQKRFMKLKRLCRQGVVSNSVAFERLLLDHRIWANAPIETQKNMMDMLSMLVSYEHPNAGHHINLFISVGVMKRFLFTLSQAFVLKKPWPKPLTKPLVNIFRFVMPSPLSVTHLFPICQYLILTHPERGISVNAPNHNQQEFDDSRNALFQLFYSLMREGSEDVLEDLHAFLPIGEVIALLDNRSDITRSHLLNILGVYITRRANLREHFKRINGVSLLTQQLLKLSPSLVEFQILFDLLLGNFYNSERAGRERINSTETPLTPMKFIEEVVPFASPSLIEPVKRTKSVESFDNIQLDDKIEYENEHKRSKPKNIQKKKLVFDVNEQEQQQSSQSPSPNSESFKSSLRKRAMSTLASSSKESTATGSLYFHPSLAFSSPDLNQSSGKRKSLIPSLDLEGKVVNTSNVGPTKKSRAYPSRKEIYVSAVDRLKFPDFLYAIFKLLPAVTNLSERLNVLRSLMMLFNEGSNALRKQFIETNAHSFLSSFLAKKVVDNNSTFMDNVLDFLVSYMTHAFFDAGHGRDGVDILHEVLQSVALLETNYSVWFVHSIQRSILHGILKNYQALHLFAFLDSNQKDRKKFNQEKKHREWMDTQFARFISCVTEYVTHWVDLPPSIPHIADANLPFEEVKTADRNWTIAPTPYSPIYRRNEEITSKPVELIDDYISQSGIEKQKTVIIPSALSSDAESHKKQLLTASFWYEFEHRILGKHDNLPQKMFLYSYDDISGFVYWLIDSIRVCIKNRMQKKGANGDNISQYPATDLLLVDQVKKLIVYLTEEKRSIEDNIFILLSVLYFFPLGSSATIKNILNGQVPTNSESFSDMIQTGKIITECSAETQFITRLLYNTSKLYSKDNSLLIQLNQKVWNIIMQTRRGYLKHIFRTDKLDPMHPDFSSIIQEITSCIAQKQFDQIILQPTVTFQVKEWESRELAQFFEQTNKRTHKVLDEDKKEKSSNMADIKVLQNETIILEVFQLKFLKPTFMKIRKLVDRDMVAMKRWKKIIKRLSDERSVLNIYFQTKNNTLTSKTLSAITSVQDYLSQNNDYHKLPFRPYDEYSFDLSFWKLDPTAGPNRIRMRLKRHAKHEVFEQGIVTDEVLFNIVSPQSDKTDEYQPLNSRSEESIKTEEGLIEKMQEQEEMNTQLADPSIETLHHPGTSERLLIEPKICTRITPLRKCEGELLLAENNIYFIGKQTRNHGPARFGNIFENHPKMISQNRQYCFPYELIKEIHKRRYLLRNSAMEIFLTNGKSLFLAFDVISDRDDVYSLLMTPSKVKLNNLSLPNLVNYEQEVNGKFILQKSITQKWQEGLISNFEYLMHLNTLAGRSFNDLTQYPVFPYIISDYESTELDLTNPNTFRDLSKPMGALSDSRLQKAIAQYEAFSDEDDLPYHWGSHYSTPVSVLYYLVRLEPFSRCFWELNGQRLDVADRTFHSIKNSWQLSSGSSKSDVKELIPEFFFLPEFLQNRNRVDFGVMQDYSQSDDVELPPWAKNNAILFVRKQREALESEYVSANLHKWIDLIFGYKQRGEESIAAHNVFHHMTYEGCAEEVEQIDDPDLREARWTQIYNFGQTPKQLFKRPHPERYHRFKLLTPNTPRTDASLRGILAGMSGVSSPESAATLLFSEPFNPKSPRTPRSVKSDATTATDVFTDDERLKRAEALDLNSPHINKIYHSPQCLTPSNVRFFKETVGDLYIVDDITSYSTNSVAAIGKNKLFIPQLGQERKKSPVYLSYQHWDQTLRICKWDTERTLHSFNFMVQPESYLCGKFSHDGKTLAFGTDTCVIHVFKINSQFRLFKKRNNKSNVRKKKNLFDSSGSETTSRYIDHVATLPGHSKRVLSVYVSSEFSMIISGSDDHSMMIWDLNRLSFIRSIKHGGPVHCISMNKANGDIASTCTNEADGRHCLYLWSVNGDLIHARYLKQSISCLAFSSVEEGIHGNVIVAGLTNGTIVVMDALDLKFFTRLKIADYSTRITSIMINPSMTEIITGDEKGVVVTWNVVLKRK